MTDWIDAPEEYPKLTELYYWEAKLYGPGDWSYYVQVKEADYHITYSGMSVRYEDGTTIRTFIHPDEDFPGCEEGLTDDQLVHLVGIEVVGESFSREEMNEEYARFQKEKGG